MNKAMATVDLSRPPGYHYMALSVPADGRGNRECWGLCIAVYHWMCESGARFLYVHYGLVKCEIQRRPFQFSSLIPLWADLRVEHPAWTRCRVEWAPQRRIKRCSISAPDSGTPHWQGQSTIVFLQLPWNSTLYAGLGEKSQPAVQMYRNEISAGILEQYLGARNLSRNRVVVPARRVT